VNSLGATAMPKSVQIETIDKEVRTLIASVAENTKSIKATNLHLKGVADAVKKLENQVRKLEEDHTWPQSHLSKL
jgi:hypothetical protein